MRIINSNNHMSDKVALGALRIFRKVYKVPYPKKIKVPFGCCYRWNDILGHECELAVLAQNSEIVAAVSDFDEAFAYLENTNPSLCPNSEMIQLVANCLEMWFKFHILGQSII